MWQGPVPRSVLLETFRDVEAAYAAVSEPLGSWSSERLEALEGAFVAAQARLVDLYLDALTPAPVSRSPFSGERLDVPLDRDGLDGPWWDYRDGVRPWWERPPDLVALTGAMRLTAPVEHLPWLVCPGPGVPYLLPRLLADEAVCAVLSTVPVGRHIGYAIAYFARTMPFRIRPANDWGAPDSRLTALDGHVGWDACFDDPETFEFDLEPWVVANRVRWIDPDDPTWTVRSGRDGCPYLSLAGSRSWQRLEEGVVR